MKTARPDGRCAFARSLALSFAAACPAFAQDAQLRAPSPLAGTVDDEVVHSEGDVSVIAWGDFPDGVFVSASDGRALEWSTPVEIAGSGNAVDELVSKSIAISGSTVWVTWTDFRSGVVELYFNRSDDGGLTWQGEELLDFGVSGGIQTAPVEAFQTAASGDHLYVLANTVDGLKLLVSDDAGVSFGPAIDLASGVGLADLCASGSRVHVAWREAGQAPDPSRTLTARSLDHGATFEPPVAVSDPSSTGSYDGLRLAVDGDRVAVLWFEDCAVGLFNTCTRLNISSDGGASWRSVPEVVGDPVYPPFVLQPAQLALAGDEVHIALPVVDTPNPSGQFIDVVGSYLRSTDGGASFDPEVLLGLYRTDFRLTAAGNDVALLHADGTGHRHATFSVDGGATFSTLEVADLTGGGDARLAFNRRYRNYVVVRDPLSVPLDVTGFRPQTLAFDDSVPGVVGAELARFTGSPVAWVLFSLAPAPGVLPFDGRALGLWMRPALFHSSVLAAMSGRLAATLGPDGSGSLADVSAHVPAGVPVYAVAVGIDPANHRVQRISDVVELMP